jgi:hypothetical protein
MKEIPLTQNKVAQVDDWNYDDLNQFLWRANKNGNTYYACRDEIIDGKTVLIKMHRQIMNTPNNLEVHHWDHNGLNCQEFNMINCTHAENSLSRSIRKHSSIYRGVQVLKNGTIVAHITTNYNRVNLGTFKTERDAAMAYNTAAFVLHGLFAELNIL